MTVCVMPVWEHKTATEWEEPGKYLSANIPEGKKKRVRVELRHYRAQIVGRRNDGKCFYLNVFAHGKSDEKERALILGRAMLRFDDFLKSEL